MATDRETLTKQVKEANDIVDVVGSYVALRPAGAAYKGLCPFHDDHNPSMTVDSRRQSFRCWSCGKSGDVFTFVQEFERVDFLEARELLARRAGITLEKTADSPQNRGRALMLEVMRWAAEQYQRCLLEEPFAETARRYLGERKLTGDTVRRFGLGYAPLAGDWLVQRARAADRPIDILETVGLVAPRTHGPGHYDRFRDRVMFPIRDVRGQTVAFGGRILPTSPLADRAPKYYNSAETPLFSKKENLYGLDQARQTGATLGYLAVVEGYMDVLMAHQLGIPQVVAPMGTAINATHVRQLRRFVPRVVLIFDGDEGGAKGVDRALEIFVSQDVDLTVATLPEGLDPCDLLVRQGADPFQKAMVNAIDALDFKLNQVLTDPAIGTVEGRRRAVDAVLGIIALAPEMPGQGGVIKRDLAINRIAQRLGLREETVRARLRELQATRLEARQPDSQARNQPDKADREAKRVATAPGHEKQLLEVLLTEPELVAKAVPEVSPEEMQHPGLRELLQGLYDLHDAGQRPELDLLRPRIETPHLVEDALQMQDVGGLNRDRAGCLRELLAEFRRRREQRQKEELQNQLHAAVDHSAAVELLRQLQNQNHNDWKL